MPEPNRSRSTLATKYRPRKLSDVVGHDSAVSILRASIKRGTVPNAYLLCGPSGVGKTTLSRVLARYYNCEDDSTVEPCGKCGSCRAMDRDDHPDYEEVNGAVNRGIDDAKRILEQVRYLPHHSLRVLCIDECHQLTQPAINTLLKSMEEPPAHLLWILATSEPDRIASKAVLGRCRILRLNPVDRKSVARRVFKVARAERMAWMTSKAAMAVAEVARGQVRDALQVLEATDLLVAESGSDALEEKEVVKLVGDASLTVAGVDDPKLAFETLLAMYTGQPKRVLRCVLDVGDHHPYLSRMLSLNLHLLADLAALGRHQSLWRDRYSQGLVKAVADRAPATTVAQVAAAHAQLTLLRDRLWQSATADARHAVAAGLVELAGSAAADAGG